MGCQHQVIAIGVESADAYLIERWINQGYLKNFKQLKQSGLYCPLTNVKHHTTETEWKTFLTGCLPQTTGYWRPLKFCPKTYSAGQPCTPYDYKEYPPFYHLSEDYRIAIFDLPQTKIVNRQNGLQVLGWGSQDPQGPSQSYPPELLENLVGTYGAHPAFGNSYGNNWWDQSYLAFLSKALKVGISRRTAIYRNLLQQGPWDLFLTSFSETHSAGHNFYHFSQPGSPLYINNGTDPLLEIYQAIDATLGELLDLVSDNDYFLVFSNLGMGDNANELPSMFFLAELLYRFNFPGKAAFTSTNRLESYRPTRDLGTWEEAVWKLRGQPTWLRNTIYQYLPRSLYPKFIKFKRRLHADGDSDSLSLQPFAQQGYRVKTQPACWYRGCWSKMKAFALPSYSDGFVRINLKGREAQGIVEPAAYDDLCAEITQILAGVTDHHSGQPLVKQVIRTRSSPWVEDSKLPDADLVVIWEDIPTNMVESVQFGKIGPIPYRRGGGHRNRGFLMAKGPGIQAGTQLKNKHAVDLPPTLLDLMDAPVPDYFEGQPIIRRTALV